VSTPLALVLDTNVVLDCYLFGDPASVPIVAALDAGHAVALQRADCVAELERVLAYARFALGPAARAAMLARYRAHGRDVADALAAPLVLPRCRDPDDQKFLELAHDGAAALLVTKDKQLLALARRVAGRAAFAIVDPRAAARALV
jgi:uncharacterized protein